MTESVVCPMCPKCHFGRLIVRKATFTSTFEGQLLVAPGISALVCDVCGETIMDQEMLHRLSGLLANERPRPLDVSSAQPST